MFFRNNPHHLLLTYLKTRKLEFTKTRTALTYQSFRTDRSLMLGSIMLTVHACFYKLLIWHITFFFPGKQPCPLGWNPWIGKHQDVIWCTNLSYCKLSSTLSLSTEALLAFESESKVTVLFSPLVWRFHDDPILVTLPPTTRWFRRLHRSLSLPATSRTLSFIPNELWKPPSSANHWPLHSLLGRDSLRWTKEAFNRYYRGTQGVASDRAVLNAPLALKQKPSPSEYRSQTEE